MKLAISCLAHFSSAPFRLKKREKTVAPSLHYFLLEPFNPLVFKYANNRNYFGDLHLWCEGRFLEIDPTPHPHISPHPNPHPCTSFRP